MICAGRTALYRLNMKITSIFNCDLSCINNANVLMKCKYIYIQSSSTKEILKSNYDYVKLDYVYSNTYLRELQLHCN